MQMFAAQVIRNAVIIWLPVTWTAQVRLQSIWR